MSDDKWSPGRTWTGRGGRLYRTVRGGLVNKMTFEQRPERSEAWAGGTWGQTIPGRRDNKRQGPKLGAGLSQKWIGDQCSQSSGRPGEEEETRSERPALGPVGDVLKALHSCPARALPRPTETCTSYELLTIYMPHFVTWTPKQLLLDLVSLEQFCQLPNTLPQLNFSQEISRFFTPILLTRRI